MIDNKYKSGQLVKPEPHGWITDRKPTGDDADEYGRVMYWKEAEGTCFVSVRYFGVDCPADAPWQPVPDCLRVKPEPVKRCEDCAHMQLVDVELDEVSATVPICKLVNAGPCESGMLGCEFKRKGES